LFGFDGWVIAKYTDIEGQAQLLAQLASTSRQSIKQKCCTGARTELLYRFEFSWKPPIFMRLNIMLFI